ncbi:MAG TPA: hypothetical protein VKE88_00765 [Candidatus Nanoarchaeia archaeon]|nr:hypothetical protein [Candidatus Nanoarchaeia archaeon]
MSWFIIKNNEQNNLESITGLNTGEVRVSILPRCNIPVQAGFNLISVCANLSNTSILNALNSVEGKYSFVLQLNETSQAFDVFDPGAATNPFDTFDINKSYFVFMTEAATLSFFGVPIGNISVPLHEEFTAPSYPYTFTTNITRYLDPIAENVSFLLKWNTSSQDFIVFSPEAAEHDFENISKGEGQFMYLITPNGVLHYNTSQLQP